MGSKERMAGFLADQGNPQARPGTDGKCRSRIRRLLDPDSFVELNSQIESRGNAYGFERAKVAGDGLVTGFGTIDDRLVYLAAQDPDVYGGSMGLTHARKFADALARSSKAGVPFIALFDTGGIRVEEGLAGLEGMGEFFTAVHQTAGDVPLIAALFGPCSGGAALAAAAFDLVLISDENGGIYLSGPQVVAASSGRNLSAKEVGGAGVQSGKTGIAAAVAADDSKLIHLLRQVMPYVPDTGGGFTDWPEADDDPNRATSALDDLASSLDDGYSVRSAIAQIFDNGAFFELYEAYSNQLVGGLARLDGRVVGVIAQTGARLGNSALRKAERLARLCESWNLPLISLVDSAGFSVELAEEQSGLAGTASSLLRAMIEIDVPRLSLIIGQAVGTAYLIFASKQTGWDLVFAWPTAAVSAVTADAGAQILYRRETAESEDPAATRAAMVERYAAEIASPQTAAALGHVDEVIAPSATRPRLISALNFILADV